MKRILFFYLYVLFTIYPLYADNVLKQISNTDGLSNNSVNCIFEDSENTIWIGTWDGLNSYDGRDIRTFRYNRNNKHSISNNVIRQIFEQDKNYLWVTTDYGINRWDKYNQEFTSFFHSAESKKPKQENSYLLGISKDKIVYAYVKEEGWFFYNETEAKFTPLQIKLKEAVKSFIIDNEDNIYILLQSGEVYTSKVGKVDNQPAISNLKKLDIPDEPIQKIFFSENKLIALTNSQIIVLNKLHNVVKKIKTDQSKNVSYLLLQKDNLYVSFYEGGCITYSLSTNAMSEVKEIPSNMPIFTLFAGSQDILWVGADGQGVMMMYTYVPLFTTVASDYSVRSFCSTNNGDILVGTKGGGIRKLNKTNNSLEQYLSTKEGLQSNSVYAIKKNGQGDIFIGTEGVGISIQYEGKENVEQLQFSSNSPSFKAVYSIHFSNNDSVVWLGTSGYGLIRADIIKDKGRYRVEKTEQFVSTTKHQAIDNDIIYAIADGRNSDEVWFGTRGAGLYKIKISANEVTKIGDSDLTNNDVLSIRNTRSGLWVGTSYGLNRLWMSNNKLFSAEYTDNQGLANNTIHGVLEDESRNIWVSTNLGVSFLDIERNRIENYTFSDGLQSNEFSDGAFFSEANNTLYFGGVDGLNYFKPENIKRRSFKSHLRLSGLRIYNTQQNIQQRIVDNTLNLSYNEQYIAFTVVTNDFINNQNCEYAYRLSDFTEEEWIHNGNNPNIIFSNLSPGDYTLEIKYTNGDKVWSDDIYTLEIHVDKPWWLSNIAIILYTIFLGIVVYIIQSVIKNRIRLNRQILLEKVEKQHQQKVHEAKLDFFTNVAHEFFTPLTLIYGPAQHLLEASNLDSYTKRYIRIIKSNAERMQKLINELMDFRKAKSGHKAIYMEQIDVKILVDYISDNYIDISEQNNISYKVDVRDSFTILSDRDFLEKILLNLISNAFKYTPTGGNIRLNVWQDESDNSLCLSIKNSGKGLTKLQMEEIFNKYKIFDNPQLKNTVSTGIGLNLTQSLIELLGGTIDVSSKYGEYVEFEVKIPPLKSKQEETITGELSAETNQMELNITSEKDVSILIVDDEKNIRELLKDILSPYYHVLEAEDGKKALDMVEYNHPDIIISDVMMPNIDGIVLIDKLKSNPNTVHIPIISISAKISIEDSIKAYKHGADLYIEKPFHPRHILSTVENLIRKQKQLKGYYNSGLSSVTIKDGIEMHKEDEKLIQDVASYIHQNINDETLNPGAIADFLGVSKATLYREFKEILNNTPSEFIRTIRLEYASKLLVSTKLTVLEVMYKSGFNNKSYFYREFAKLHKMSPVEYRNKTLGSED